MQLTNVQVLNALQSLNSLSQNKLPIRLAWKVTTAVRSLQEFAKSLDEPMQEIRTKHALRDEAGNLVEAVDEKGEKVPNTIQIPNDKIATVNQEMNDLLSITVEVNNVEFSLSDFPETLELEPAVLSGLTPLIKDEPTQELKLVQ
jgi:uncharacterized FlaG/YvyC family protein